MSQQSQPMQSAFPSLEQLKEQIDACDLALITIGNSGKGKTLIDNIILGEDLFTHLYRVTSVTRLTEAAFTMVNGLRTVVYNVPGLREISKSNVASNKIEIAKAFARQPNQVILVIFGVGDSGRIVEEDVSTYISIVEAFGLTRSSTVFIINNVDPIRNTPSYQADTIMVLKDALEWPNDVPLQVVFSQRYAVISEGEDPAALYSDPQVLAFRSNLMQAITTAIPFKHVQKKNIELADDVIEATKIRLKSIQDDMDTLRKRHASEMNALTEQIKEQTKVNADNAARYQREIQEARDALHREMAKVMRQSMTSAGNPGGSLNHVKGSVSYKKDGFSISVDFGVNK